MVNRPVVFIGSSSESLALAEAIQVELHSEQIEAVVWRRLFEPGEMTLEALDKKASDFDFAVLVLSGDDVLESRGATTRAPRDNLLFELGLFVGRLGRDRSFYLFKSTERTKLPSDLAGATGVEYTEPGSFGLAPAVAGACQQLRSRILAMGPRDRAGRHPAMRIDFAYLPEVPVEARGWKLGHNMKEGRLPTVEVLEDRRFGRALVMKAEDGAYMDLELPYLVSATDVELLVKSGGWVVYPIIDLRHSKDGKTLTHAYLRLSEWDQRVQKFNDCEWFVPHRAVPIEHDWHSVLINIPRLVAMTFATEGWLYWRIRGIRLRGRVTLSSVAIYS